MPRISQIVNTTSIQGAGVSISGAMQPGLAASRVGDQVATLGQDVVNEQIHLQRVQQATELTSQAAVETNDLFDQITHDPSVANNDLTDNVQDGYKIIHARIAQNIHDPQVRAVFDDNFSGLTVQSLVKSRALQRSRGISDAVNSSNNSIDTYSALPVDASEQRQDALIAQIHGTLARDVANGLRTSEQAGAKLKEALDTVSNAKVIKLIRNDPAGAYSALQADTIFDLDPVRRQDFLDQAKNQLLAQWNETNRAARQAAEDADKAEKQTAENVTARDVDLARDGKLPLTTLQQHLTDYNLSPAQYDLVRNYINKGPDHPSDPHKLLDYTIAVNSSSATAGLQTRLARDYTTGALARDDYWQLQTRLAENLKRSEATDGKIKARQAQAEQMLRADFGVTSPLDQITGASKNAYAMALEELTRRSQAFGGPEDPLQIEPQIRAKYAPIGLFATKQAIDRLRGNLRFKTIEEIGTREQARARGMSDAEYNQLVHRISELDTADQNLQ